MKKLLGILLALAFLVPASSVQADMLQIKGSDTLINLVQELSEEYMNTHAGEYVAVTGGGSGTGIAALINDKCDIANASRTMKPKEVQKASDNGVSVNRVIIAMDGLSVIVNPSNPVSKLTISEIGAIFKGDITNWSEVGGNPGPITLYGRQSNSGTFVFFRDVVLKGDYSQSMNRMNGNAQLVESVKADSSAITYVGVGYVKNASGIKVLEVAAHDGAPYASPFNSMDIQSGKYPIARPLNQYINGKPSGDVKKFINFELSEIGQKIVEEQGFFPVPDEYVELNSKLGF